MTRTPTERERELAREVAARYLHPDDEPDHYALADDIAALRRTEGETT